jgi:hypothetical protein
VFLVVKYQLMHHQVSTTDQGNMNKVTEEGNKVTHMQEMATMMQEAGFHLHMDTSRLVATCIHHNQLLPHRVLDCMGNPRQCILGFVVEATSPLHMVDPNSGSNNHILHMLEEGLMEADNHPQELIHDCSNHRTVTVLWTEIPTGDLHLDMADRRF